jgi:manganese/zinc/iron transport system permease protein
MRVLDVLLTSLLVVAIVIGLQAVGVVLMSAMIVAPAAAARQWTDRLGVMVLLSGLFGGLAGVSGALISSMASGLSTGPTIVLCASLLVLISLLFAPNRGLAARWLREQRSRATCNPGNVLNSLYTLAASITIPACPCPSVIRLMGATGANCAPAWLTCASAAGCRSAAAGSGR